MDANAMQHGVEVAAPFLAKDVVDLVLNLPAAARVLPRRRESCASWRTTIFRPASPGGEGWRVDARDGRVDHRCRPSEFLLRGMLADTLEIPAARWQRPSSRWRAIPR